MSASRFLIDNNGSNQNNIKIAISKAKQCRQVLPNCETIRFGQSKEP
ncbi:Uncharacterised protein [Enterobacter hormaechei]|nr:Uncharacterised protein [Enterobacter hormaechei]